MITIAERIEVPSSPQSVWEVLADPDALISCISGAELRERHDDGSFDAALGVKFGGLRVSFNAHAILDLDGELMEGRLSARGNDRQGATRVSSETRFKVSRAEQGRGSTVTVDGEMELGGKLASIIDQGAGVVVARMSRDFAAALTARCEADGSQLRPAADLEPAIAAAGPEVIAIADGTVASDASERHGSGGWFTRLQTLLLDIIRPSRRTRRVDG